MTQPPNEIPPPKNPDDLAQKLVALKMAHWQEAMAKDYGGPAFSDSLIRKVRWYTKRHSWRLGNGTAETAYGGIQGKSSS